MKKFTLTIFVCMALVFGFANTTFAHVAVKPGEVMTATHQVFVVNVPNEKDIPTVSVKLLISKNISSVTPTVKSGWEIVTEKENEKVKSITWSGGEIAEGLRDEFTFSAKTPDQPTELKWKAYQTYSDGTVVAWDQEKSDDKHGDNSGPFSVTIVTTKSADATANTDSAESIDDVQASSDRAFYIGIVGVVVGLVAVFLATRKK